MILLTFGLIKLWMEIVMDYERDFELFERYLQ